jgi:hypothetical protein
MAKGLIVPADDSRPITVGEFSDFEDYRKVVDGYTEHIDVDLLDLTICVNGEGLLQQLPVNPRVTLLWWYHVPSARRRAMLVGNAVLVGWPDIEGAATDIAEDLVLILREPGDFRVEIKWDADGPWLEYGFKFATYFEALAWTLVLDENIDAAQLKVVSRLNESGASE